MSLSILILSIFHFTQDDPQKRITRALEIKASLVSKIVKDLQDACSLDIMSRPFILFRGPGTVVKCDKSKFNHKVKVKLTRCSLFTVEFPNVLLLTTSFPGQFLTFCGGQEQSEAKEVGGSNRSLGHHAEFVNCCSTTEGEGLPVTHGYLE